MEIWVTITDYNHYGDSYIDLHLFSTEDKARAYLNSQKCEFYENNHLSDIASRDPDEVVIEDTENSFCAYIDGQYYNDHFSVSIKRSVVDSVVDSISIYFTNEV